jgi:outer membrane protein TolC
MMPGPRRYGHSGNGRSRLLGPILAVAWLCAGALAAAELPIVRVGVVVDGPWEGNPGIRDLTRTEITTLTAGEFDIRFPDESYLIGDWSAETAQRNLETLLEDPGVDVVITWGMLVSHAVCCGGALPKPVIAPVMIDRAIQGAPFDNGASGVHNLSYVSLPNNLANELGFFRQMVPFRKVAILTIAALIEAIPRLELRTLEIVRELGLDFEYIGVSDSAAEALAAISPEVDAVFAWPLFLVSPEERRKLIDGLNERRLPTFSALGGVDVELGMLASLGSDEFLPRLTRRIALNLQRILLGAEPGELPVAFETRDQITINMATARAIGVSPSWDILVEARLLHPEAADLPTLALEATVDLAIEANLDLAARRLSVAAGRQDVTQARSAFLPQFDVSATGVQIDDDRAAASFGSQAERTLTSSAAVSQLIFSDGAAANLAIQRHLQQSREEDFEILRLDIALQAAVTYLNLLRAKTLVQVQRNNLELTRSNLELARIRRTIGAANPAEVFRWESQVATDRKELIEAMAQRRVAEIAINRLLHRDLEERFLTAEVNLDDPYLITGQERFQGYTTTPQRLRVLRDFMVDEGLAASPELRQLGDVIAAQRRAVTAARRAHWVPTIGLQAGLDERLSRSGLGSEPVSLPGFDLPAADDSSWSLGLTAAVTLFAGGSKRAAAEQALLELDRLTLERDAVAERISQRIRSGVELARASFAGIELSRQASAAAGKSLDLVADAYARGAVSILDLLDAQNVALNAELLEANSIYDFFIDLMEVQRAANRFDFFLGPVERDLWYERLEQFFERAAAMELNR